MDLFNIKVIIPSNDLRLFIEMVLGGSLGLYLKSLGYGVSTKQYWIILALICALLIFR